MQTKIVLSKRFDDSPIQINVTNYELSLSMDLRDFLVGVAAVARPELIDICSESVGFPAMLLTNAQVKSKMEYGVSQAAVLDVLVKACNEKVEDMKASSVMAE